MRRWLLLALLVATDPAEGASSHPHERSGLYVGVALGAGSGQVQLPGADDLVRRGGSTFDVRLGGALGPAWLLGYQGTGYYRRENGDTTLLGSSLLVATHFFGEGGPFASLGVGVAHVRFDPAGIDSERGFALHAAGGYEWRLTPRFAFAPKFQLDGMLPGGGVDFARVLAFKLQGTWY